MLNIVLSFQIHEQNFNSIKSMLKMHWWMKMQSSRFVMQLILSNLLDNFVWNAFFEGDKVLKKKKKMHGFKTFVSFYRTSL